MRSADLITNKRSIENTVLVDDGQIVVIGGLIADDAKNGEGKIPLLGDIPVIGNLFKESSKTSSKTVVRGLSVNGGIYEGVARRIDGPSQFDRLQQGDVLVTRSTAPYFNVVLPLLGAIVTDRGGQLCHAAIVAREYGIPGIVGTKEATALIPDGARVRVDGGSGEITILST